MTIPLQTLVDRLRRHYDDGCFACGRDNPIGLHLDSFAMTDGVVTALFDPRPDYRGAGRSLHGGIAATALDEILVWAGLLAERVMSVTGRMEVRYRRPVEVTESIEARGWVEERSGRRLRVSGELRVGGEVRVEAGGLYLVTATLEELGVLDGSGGDHAGVEMGDIS